MLWSGHLFSVVLVNMSHGVIKEATQQILKPRHMWAEYCYPSIGAFVLLIAYFVELLIAYLLSC